MSIEIRGDARRRAEEAARRTLAEAAGTGPADAGRGEPPPDGPAEDLVLFGPGSGRQVARAFDPAVDRIVVAGAGPDDLRLAPAGDGRVWYLHLRDREDDRLKIVLPLRAAGAHDAAAIRAAILTEADEAPPRPAGGPTLLAARSRVATPDGAAPLRDLAPGDLVLTRDDGPQPVRAVLSGAFAAEDLGPGSSYRSVHMPAGALGDGRPERPLRASRAQAVLMCTPDGAERLVRAGHLAALLGRARTTAAPERPVRYVGLVLDAHHLIRAEGVWTESVFVPPPGAAEHAALAALAPDGLPPATRRRARPLLSAAEIGPIADSLRPADDPAAG